MTEALSGRVAVVTGAGRGQGRSHALRLAEDGADVIAIDICQNIESVEAIYQLSTSDDLDDTARLVESTGQRAVTIQADVRDFEALSEQIGAAVSALGRLDIVVANAAVLTLGPPAHEVSEAAWVDTIDVNLTGTWHTCKATIPHILAGERGGSIVLIGSTAARKAVATVAAYSAAKHGVVGLTKALALELAPYFVRVNVVHPTGVRTPMIDNATVRALFVPDEPSPSDDSFKRALIETNALPIPWCEARDISNAVAWLASDQSRFVTGAEIPVDAGNTVL